MPKKKGGDAKGGKGGKGGKGKGSKSKKSKGGKKSKPSTIIEPIIAAPIPVVQETPKVEPPPLTSKDPCCMDPICCKPNCYPGLLMSPQAMAIVGSECGGYDSLCKLFKAGLRCADRVFAMTPWGNYVLFRCSNSSGKVFFIYDGCTCNVNRFRYMDLTCGTAGLLYFDQMHKIINYIIESREMRSGFRNIRKSVIDDICREFCEYGNNQ